MSGDEMYDGLDERTRNELKLEAAESALADLRALADRLAEAAKPAIEQLYSYGHGPGFWAALPLEKALAAYWEEESVVHPDTERLDFIESRCSIDSTYEDRGVYYLRLPSFDYPLHGSANLRTRVDYEREGERDEEV